MFSVSALSISSFAVEESIECGLPLDVWEPSEGYVPEGIAYEYSVDENGYYTLVDDSGDPLPLDEEMTVTHVPWGSVGIEGSMAPTMECDLSPLYDENGNYQGDEEIPEGIIYEYVTDAEGNFVLVGETFDLTEVFDPEGEPMPEGAFASPESVEVTGGNWLTGIIRNIFQFFFS